ncbi:MAG: hypothetical protein WD382_09545 [Halofilum sp. (in: g-proteobacteria)]
MAKKYDVLILGATYGSLLAIKLSLAGHNCKLVCLPEEAELINAEGLRVKMPAKGHDGLVEVASRNAPGAVSAAGPGEVNPADFDLVALAMQEPQYKSPGVRELTLEVAKAGVPCLSIMNMPPLTYLARIPGLDVSSLRDAYTDPTIWDAFDPAAMSLCSPDPQAFRPPEEPANTLQVSLPTNFKAARFESDIHTAMLRDLESDIDAIRYDTGEGQVELPVKLKVFESIYVPMAKWSMLITGNYRCVQPDDMIPVNEAVNSDVERSRAVYDWVLEVVQGLGAAPEDLVPFEKYANAAESLIRPSSAARALFAGAPNIERVDRLVQAIAKQQGKSRPELDEVVALVDARLGENRKAA